MLQLIKLSNGDSLKARAVILDDELYRAVQCKKYGTSVI